MCNGTLGIFNFSISDSKMFFSCFDGFEKSKKLRLCKSIEISGRVLKMKQQLLKIKKSAV